MRRRRALGLPRRLLLGLAREQLFPRTRPTRWRRASANPPVGRARPPPLPPAPPAVARPLQPPEPSRPRRLRTGQDSGRSPSGFGVAGLDGDGAFDLSPASLSSLAGPGDAGTDALPGFPCLPSSTFSRTASPSFLRRIAIAALAVLQVAGWECPGEPVSAQPGSPSPRDEAAAWIERTRRGGRRLVGAPTALGYYRGIPREQVVEVNVEDLLPQAPGGRVRLADRRDPDGKSRPFALETRFSSRSIRRRRRAGSIPAPARGVSAPGDPPSAA